MSTSFWSKGLRFFCTQCSRCCRHDTGYVFLSPSDVERLVDYTGLREKDFIRKYCTWVPFGQGAHLSLREQGNNDCIFWKNGGCQVYPVRPFQCRSYPFWKTILEKEEAWEREKRECPGIGIGPIIEREEIEDLLAKRSYNFPMYREPGAKE